MAGKMTFLIGLGAGYVLGARSGRERYEQIAGKAQELWRDPRVQQKAGKAQQLVKEKAGDAGSMMAHKVAEKTGSGDAGTGPGAGGPGAGGPGVGGPGAGTTSGVGR